MWTARSTTHHSNITATTRPTNRPVPLALITQLIVRSAALGGAGVLGGREVDGAGAGAGVMMEVKVRVAGVAVAVAVMVVIVVVVAAVVVLEIERRYGG